MTGDMICPVECTQCPIEDCWPRKLRTLVDFKRMVNRYNGGMTTISIAESFDVSKRTVERALEAGAAGKLTNIPLVSTR